METKYKYHKYNTISNWKYKGVLYDDWDELYYTYIRTLNCSHCNKEFKNSLDRHLDHDHETGLLRAIVCRGCNIHDSYIKYPDGYDRKLYNENNKEKQKEYFREYNKQNKEKINKVKKIYYEDNKDKIAEIKKKYYEDNRDKIVKYREANKEKIVKLQKEYNEKNKEKIAKQKKEYRLKNKEKITKKYDCECGGKYTHEYKKQHLKTIKHTAWFMEQVD
tara:strand:+ start:40 stop:696 length:657 start_codon:yes stop_codon:yes gene_type:complete